MAWAGVQAYRFLQSEEGQEVVRAGRVARQSQDGPGSRELRELGCEAPVVTDFASMVETAPSQYPQATRDFVKDTDAGNAPVVMCQDPIGELASCERVAATYAAAVSPSRGFLVLVIRGIEAKCGSVAARSGEILGPIDGETLASLAERDESGYSVVITGLLPEWKIRAIKAVRSETGLGLADAKRMVEETPSTAKTGLARAEAEAVAARLRSRG